MGVKISDLTAKGSKIASTDIVEVSVDTGSSFVSRKVTGSELNELSLDTSPQLGGNLDVNGNKITSASNGNISIEPNGTGAVVIGGNSTQATELRFMEDSDNGTNYVALKANNTLAANTTYTLPTADGSSGQVLSTNGTGTLSWATAGGGITVGTTPITSGVAGRVLFEGAGNVVQESARMVFDGSKYVYDGTSVTANASTFEILGAGGQRGLWVFQDNSAKIGGNNNNFITKGTGTGQSTNNFYSNDSHFCFGGVDSSKGWVHVGANNVNPQARLDVRAQGALSTDIAFRVRNSANTYDIIRVNGDSSIQMRDSADTYNKILIGANGSMTSRVTAATAPWQYYNVSGALKVQIGIENGQGSVVVNGGFAAYSYTDNRAINAGVGGRGKFTIGYASNGLVLPNEASTNILFIANGTAPALNYADNFQLYSADIVAGNAAPHFRTENGAIVKVYQETTAVGASTFVANTSLIANDTATFDGYTIGQVVKALRNLGILA